MLRHRLIFGQMIHQQIAHGRNELGIGIQRFYSFVSDAILVKISLPFLQARRIQDQAQIMFQCGQIRMQQESPKDS